MSCRTFSCQIFPPLIWFCHDSQLINQLLGFVSEESNPVLGVFENLSGAMSWFKGFCYGIVGWENWVIVFYL